MKVFYLPQTPPNGLGYSYQDDEIEECSHDGTGDGLEVLMPISDEEWTVVPADEVTYIH